MSSKYKEEEKGEVDQQLLNGPVEQRSCQDVLCLFFFVGSIVAMAGIFLTGITKGHPKRLAAPFDSDGYACGIDGNRSQYPYIYFVTPVLGLKELFQLFNNPFQDKQVKQCAQKNVPNFKIVVQTV